MTVAFEKHLDEPRQFLFTREQYYTMGSEGFFDGQRVELIEGEIFDKYPDAGDGPRVRRFTRREYLKLADLGFFEGTHVELVEGEIIAMAPQKNPHVLGVSLATQALSRIFGDEYWIRIQAPLSFGDSAPEPDVAVVRGSMRSFQDHPAFALLVVEISDTTLRFDRGKRASLYARAGIDDYWIVNLIDNCVEVMREPIEDATAPFGYRYKSTTALRVPQSISPLANPTATIPVADLLP